MSPRIDYLVVTLLVGDETHIIVVGDFLYLLAATLNDFLLLGRNDDVAKVERKTSHVCHAITQVLDTVKELASLGHTDSLDYVGNQATESLLGNDIVEEAHLCRNDAVHNDTTYRRFHHALLNLSVYQVVYDHLDQSVEVTLALVVGNQGLLGTIECQTLALGTGTNLGDIIETEHHIL